MKYLCSLFILLILIQLTGCGKSAKPVAEEMPASAAIKHDAQPDVLPVAVNKSDAQLDAKVFYHAKTSERKIALTFDDGPDNKYTPKVLDILKKNGIKATFFVIGEHAEQNHKMIKRIVEEGHIIGNHSWDHANLSNLPSDQVQAEITKTDDIIRTIVGQSPSLFRAPYGAENEQVRSDAAKTGHQLIGWSVDTLDWNGKNASQIMNTVKKETKPGAIILQHSAGGKGGNLSNTIEALPQIIAYLKHDGYAFVTVPELMHLNQTQ
nr:polysaccharide deacetylase family protein [Paenibacillus sp. SYP-B3998]